MILPIYAYGQPVLKKKAKPIDSDYPELAKLIDDMWETMYNASGVGIAAPQIGLSIRLFVIDTIQIQKEGEENLGVKKVFINANILETSGELWSYEEGCLSIPNINGDVERESKVVIEYMDENFKPHKSEFDGMTARVIMHEYDHIEGILFTEKLSLLKRKLIQRKLDAIRAGKSNASYRIKYLV